MSKNKENIIQKALLSYKIKTLQYELKDLGLDRFQLEQELKKLYDWNWGICLVRNSQVYDIKIVELTKQKKRLGTFVEIKLKLPKVMTREQQSCLKKWEKEKSIIRKGNFIFCCESFSFLKSGTRKGYAGSHINHENGKWKFDGEEIPKKDLKEVLSKIKEEVKEKVGQKAFNALSKGAVLNCWRNSSPHNWWVEDSKGKMLWHSDGWGDVPNLILFQKVSDSSQRVSYGASFFRGADDGMPQHSKFKMIKI